VRDRYPASKPAYFVRHGESEANVGRPVFDEENIRLTDRGRAQANAVANVLHPLGPRNIVLSPYLRTRLTAEPLLALNPTIVPNIWPVQEFNYIAYPPGIAITPEYRRQRSIEYWTRADPDYIAGPNTESFRQFIGRVWNTLQRIQQLPDTTMVFTHGTFMKALIWLSANGLRPEDITSQNMKEFLVFDSKFDIPNTAVIKVENGKIKMLKNYPQSEETSQTRATDTILSEI